MKSSRSMEPQLSLGVKGRLNNQEMQQLRSQLAQAAAYAHKPEQADRAAKSQLPSKPMTKFYRRVASHQHTAGTQGGPSRKTFASIEYEKQFSMKAYDSLKPRPTRGISTQAKTLLQDEYVTKPREVSCIPQNLAISKPNNDTGTDNQVAGGKRHGPSTIPQVFIM